MAIAHRQFLSMEVFPSANGRTGRMLNSFYFVASGVLHTPMMCLSRQLVRTREYYSRRAESPWSDEHWEGWVAYMLNMVEFAAVETVITMGEIQNALADYRRRIQTGHRFYSRELVDVLFLHPCLTAIDLAVRTFKVSRITATKLFGGADGGVGFLRKERVGRCRAACRMSR